MLTDLNVGLVTYSEEFLVLDKVSTAIFDNPIFNKKNVIDQSKKLISFPDITLSLNSIGRQENSRQQVFITISKFLLQPNCQDIVEVSILLLVFTKNNAIAIIEPPSLFKRKSSLCVTSPINNLIQKKYLKLKFLT